MSIKAILVLLFVAVVTVACGKLHGDAGDLADLVFGSGGKIPRGKLGVQNEFGTNPKGDSIAQGNDIRNTLNLRHIRSSFCFDEGFLPSEASSPDFSHFDAILASIPPQTDLLAILGCAPGWLGNRSDWKEVFVDRYVAPVLDRYGGDQRIAGWEIWNEPDGFCNGNQSPPGVLDCSPADYVDLVARVAPEIRRRSVARVVGAASTSINQSFPDHFNFNKNLVGAGLLDFIDVYNFHWYGSQLEKLSFGGIADFLNGTGKEVWCTESGDQGSTNQLAHAQDVFPALNGQIDRLERIYIFTYFDGAGPASTFGLVAGDGTESDLYQFLRAHP